MLGGVAVPRPLARQSAKAVAGVLVTHKAKALEHHALGEIQNWRDLDEAKVQTVRDALQTGNPLADAGPSPIYAAHAVAAAALEALGGTTAIPDLLTRMLAILNVMHDQNPSWGPLYVRHPGDIARHRLYIPTPKRG